jgi:biopolymer transport protein ExbD
VTGGDRETRVFLRADQAVAYGDLMEVMNLLRLSGYVRIALVGLESVNAVAAPTGEAAQAPE